MAENRIIWGLVMSSINWDLWNFGVGAINVIVVIALYIITYKKLDKRTIVREKNKTEISLLLMQACYQECLQYVALLNRENVNDYIVPKMDFNSTNIENSIIGNIQKSPFVNENNIMDLVKDGHVAKGQVEGYFSVKEKYRQYVAMRVIFFDAPHIYEPLKTDLSIVISRESGKLKKQM